MKDGGEIGRQIRVKRNNRGDVPIKFLDECNVFDHVVGDLGLVILVDLLNQHAIPVQNGLNLLETLV